MTESPRDSSTGANLLLVLHIVDLGILYVSPHLLRLGTHEFMYGSEIVHFLPGYYDDGTQGEI